MQSVSFYACALNSEVQRLNIFQLYFIPCVMEISSVKCQFMKGNVIYMCVSDYIVSVKWYRHWSDNANEDGRQRWVGEKKIEILLCMIRCDIASRFNVTFQISSCDKSGGGGSSSIDCIVNKNDRFCRQPSRETTNNNIQFWKLINTFSLLILLNWIFCVDVQLTTNTQTHT